MITTMAKDDHQGLPNNDQNPPNNDGKNFLTTPTQSSRILLTSPPTSYHVQQQQQDISNNKSSLVILNSISYPKHDCLRHAPINQPYYPFMFTIDTEYYDFCNLRDKTSLPPEFYVSGIVPESGDFSCVNYLCRTENVWNLRNVTQRMNLGIIFNYCLRCNQSASELFRQALMNNSCPAFVIGASENSTNLIPSDRFMSKFNQISNIHCNGASPSSINNLALLDYNFFMSEYFMNRFARYRERVTGERQSNPQLTVSSVSLNPILTFYFKNYFDDNADLSTLNAPLDVPFICWCNYQSDKDKSFGFQCNDFFQNWQIYFTYRYSIWIFALIFSAIFVAQFLLVLVPRFGERIITFKQRLKIQGLSSSVPQKIVLFFRHFFDIVTQPPPFFTIAALLAFMENFMRILFNFKAANPFFRNYFSGVFRGLACGFTICGYSSLVISWSHVIDLSNRRATTDSKQGTGLSKLNTIILSAFYFAMLIIVIVSVIVFGVTKQDSYAWILLSLCIVIYLFTFVLGFAFYGFRIMYKLRKTVGDTKKVMEYRFTKFMLAETGVFLAGCVISALMFVSYVFGFDIMNLFWGMARNTFMDSALTLVISVSSIITFNETAIEMVYGKRILEILTCSSCKQKKMNHIANVAATNESELK
ncbi:hypothetical protein FDP41_006399 [Naegleria fowleri]|uniref:Uncharacterized protein n=1 Tax=Naegleria fowleri TaxID=5763 RepID=A0A6A5BB21_NAEFO|nr:uncharacterized protein FDP41_006399 [Naegleria fowleri]KAF0974367.1 hypothetical protein FDP41_006399 [Naegleria fowleri]